MKLNFCKNFSLSVWKCNVHDIFYVNSLPFKNWGFFFIKFDFSFDLYNLDIFWLFQIILLTRLVILRET